MGDIVAFGLGPPSMPTNHRSGGYQVATNDTCRLEEQRARRSHPAPQLLLLMALKEVPRKTQTEEASIDAALTVRLWPWCGPTADPSE